MPNIDPSTSDHLKISMASLCEKHQAIFTEFSGFDRQPTDKEFFHIDVPADTAPERANVGRVPYSQRLVIEECVTNLLKLGIIRTSTSAWSARTVLVEKDDNTRFCVNYSNLNKHNKRLNWPSPFTEDVIDALAGCIIYLTADLAKAVHQWEILPSHCHYTAFITHLGLFEFVRVPFGVTNGSVN